MEIYQHGYCWNKAYVLVVNFFTMATSHRMPGTYFPHFDLDSSIFYLSFGEFFSNFATSWKWYCLTFWNVKNSELFRRLFQCSVICHSSKYIGLALTEFNKNTVFYRVYMWLQLSQIKKKFNKGNARKPAFIYYTDVTKIRKTCVGHTCPCLVIHLSTRSYDAMYRVREGKRKLEPFYRLFRELFCHIFWPQA